MRVVLTGASGQLGAYLAPALIEAGHELDAWSGTEAGCRGRVRLAPIDVTDFDALARALASANPGVVLHAAAVSSAESARRDPERARLVNTGATEFLAGWCARHGRRIVYTSTDMVFDGSRSWYREDDPAEPVLTYGRTKRDGEAAVIATPRGLVARVPLLFGPSRCGRENYFDRSFNALRRGEPQSFFEDEFRTALDFATAAAIVVRLAETELAGIIHVGGVERVSRYDLMRRVAVAQGIDPALVRANRLADMTLAEPRPADVSLDTSRLAAVLPGVRRPTIEEAAIAAMAGG
jgi:dTDP-4-dehydrorhamnose reductase